MNRIRAYISTPPSKVVYQKGEKFDPTGMKITCEIEDDNECVRKYNIENMKKFLFDYIPFKDSDTQ